MKLERVAHTCVACKQTGSLPEPLKPELALPALPQQSVVTSSSTAHELIAQGQIQVRIKPSDGIKCVPYCAPSRFVLVLFFMCFASLHVQISKYIRMAPD